MTWPHAAAVSHIAGPFVCGDSAAHARRCHKESAASRARTSKRRQSAKNLESCVCDNLSPASRCREVFLETLFVLVWKLRAHGELLLPSPPRLVRVLRSGTLPWVFPQSRQGHPSLVQGRHPATGSAIQPWPRLLCWWEGNLRGFGSRQTMMP